MPDSKGNTHLIAAAPELLAALQACITGDDARCFNGHAGAEYRLRAINEIARAAIAKAKGGAA